jgi:lipopolysaccharide/colanic/teichoic acid biosynthesis glycosyltransferase
MKYNGSLKRAFDIAVSSLCAISLAVPVMAAAAVNACILRENPFYIAERVGKNGQLFNMIKLKSMRTAYDKNGNLLPEEQRLTKFGEFLQHTGFDEFPQFLNVVKGDMSLVGPRPVNIEEFNDIDEKYRKLLVSVRPGITGPWQVSAIGRETTKKERVQNDLAYTRSRISFYKDLKYMLSTLPSFWYGHDKPTYKL